MASAVSASLNQLGLAGVAIEKSTGSNNYVELISGTIGPQSSIVVLGGRAQNVFKFPQPLPASGNFSTTWGITSQSGGVLRFTWIGGATPNLGKAEPGDYVNIFGGGFASSNYEGNFPLIDVAGGSMGESYFDILNPFATTGSVVQGLRDGLYDDVMLFYRPVKRTVSSNLSYAAIYQAVPRVLQIFLPATTRVVRRSREGSAHLHDAPQGTFLFNTQPNPGDIFGITASINLVAGTDFAIAANTPATIANMVGALNLQPGLVAEANSSVGGIIEDIDVVNIQNDSLDNQLTITYTGSADVIASGPQGENISLQPNQPGPYIYDTTQPFTVSSIHTTLSKTLNGSSSRVVTVSNSQAFPNAMGNLILDYGQTNQEIVPYLATPSNNTLLLSPAYTVQKTHLPGADVRFLESLAPPVLPANGSAFEFFLTSEVEGTAYAEALIQSVAAAGISVVFTILYSSDIGLGKWGSQYSEISYVYGPDSALP